MQERKRKYDLREIWNVILYLVKTGCQWRMLPSNLAPWELVYYYYRKWCSLGEFDLLLNNLREKVRIKHPRRSSTHTKQRSRKNLKDSMQREVTAA